MAQAGRVIIIAVLLILIGAFLGWVMVLTFSGLALYEKLLVGCVVGLLIVTAFDIGFSQLDLWLIASVGIFTMVISYIKGLQLIAFYMPLANGIIAVLGFFAGVLLREGLILLRQRIE